MGCNKVSIMESINTEHGTFTSNEETGKTAEEAYNEYLTNLSKTDVIEQTIEDRVGDIELALAQMFGGAN